MLPNILGMIVWEAIATDSGHHSNACYVLTFFLTALPINQPSGLLSLLLLNLLFSFPLFDTTTPPPPPP